VVGWVIAWVLGDSPLVVLVQFHMKPPMSRMWPGYCVEVARLCRHGSYEKHVRRGEKSSFKGLRGSYRHKDGLQVVGHQTTLQCTAFYPMSTKSSQGCERACFVGASQEGQAEEILVRNAAGRGERCIVWFKDGMPWSVGACVGDSHGRLGMRW
jgi:hypothetical protein